MAALRALLSLVAAVVLGAFIGGVVGYASYEPDPSCAPTAMWDAPCDYGPGFEAFFGAFVGGVAGLVVGLIALVLVSGSRTNSR